MNRDKFVRLFNLAPDHLGSKKLKKNIRRSIAGFKEKSNVEHCHLIIAEELSELTQQVTKAGRGIPDKIGMIEEIADVSIVIAYLQEFYGISTLDIYKGINVKVDRLEEYLNNGGIYL